jgi:hypothetical protein
VDPRCAYPDKQQKLLGEDRLGEQLHDEELAGAGVVRTSRESNETRRRSLSSHGAAPKFTPTPASAIAHPAMSPTASFGETAQQQQDEHAVGGAQDGDCVAREREIGARVPVVAAPEELTDRFPFGSPPRDRWSPSPHRASRRRRATSTLPRTSPHQLRLVHHSMSWCRCVRIAQGLRIDPTPVLEATRCRVAARCVQIRRRTRRKSSHFARKRLRKWTPAWLKQRG